MPSRRATLTLYCESKGKLHTRCATDVSWGIWGMHAGVGLRGPRLARGLHSWHVVLLSCWGVERAFGACRQALLVRLTRADVRCYPDSSSRQRTLALQRPGLPASGWRSSVITGTWTSMGSRFGW